MTGAKRRSEGEALLTYALVSGDLRILRAEARNAYAGVVLVGEVREPRARALEQSGGVPDRSAEMATSLCPVAANVRVVRACGEKQLCECDCT